MAKKGFEVREVIVSLKVAYPANQTYSADVLGRTIEMYLPRILETPQELDDGVWSLQGATVLGVGPQKPLSEE